ncbi:gas vesicle accessory protein GvpU [Alteribacillus sp. HJP-4]|uniref:gas vesicle accessory protein GvpU n=1 Tax=Alteribacillus sp. HJP-4 TaxID=2775394 RepID=UPI0035CD2605
MKEEMQDVKNIDYVLRYLVRLADNGAELDITLNVSGITISGILIGNVAYLTELENELQNNEQNELEEKMSTFFDKLSEKFQKDNDQDEYETGYLHLKQAKIIKSQGQFLIGSGLWRGKIADVNGFSFESVKEKEKAHG